MWVKRDVWLSGERKIASLESQVDLRKGQIARLEKEIDYWRGKFEAAQNRADRAQDRAFQAREMPPVSDLGVREFEEERGKLEVMLREAQKQSADMFSDETVGMELQVAPDLLSALEQSLGKE